MAKGHGGKATDGTVVSCQIWLSNYRQDFVPMNEAYVKAFKGYEPLPVRTCVGVAVLPKDTDIEITVVSAVSTSLLGGASVAYIG